MMHLYKVQQQISNRVLSVIVFSLFFSWLLTFPFEGKILYGLAAYYDIYAHSFVFGTIAAHAAGLLVCGYFIKSLRTAKGLILFSIAFCIVASSVFFRPPSFLWTIALLASAFLVGCCVAAWGFCFKKYTNKDERFKTMADGLIFSNILMLLINMSAIHLSPKIGLGFSMLMLLFAFLFALLLPKETAPDNSSSSRLEETSFSKYSPLAFLFLFIAVISINAGLMYQVIKPAFPDLQWLTSWYWAVPYIVALFIMRNLPRKTNRTYILYVAIAMVGFSFIAFLALDRSWVSYVMINTLMLGASGVFDLFWWSIMGEMLEMYKNPARVMGVGLSSNVLGILMGGFIGYTFTSSNGYYKYPTLIALGVVCITLVLLPPLLKSLTTLLKTHIYLTTINEKPAQEQIRLVHDLSMNIKLTDREREITYLLIKGKTYRLISAELHVSENTVKTHVKNIYSKAGVQSKTELMSLFPDT